MKRKLGAFSPVIAVDRAAAKPMHRQIYDAYREAIVSGSLRPGAILASKDLVGAGAGDALQEIG